MLPPVVWVLGGPGAGKGTQCQLISSKFGYHHLSSGDLLRREVLTGTDLKNVQIFKAMEKGTLVEDEDVVRLLGEEMKNSEKANGFVIDGFPANLNQAKLFEQNLGSPSHIIKLEVSNGVMRSRLLARGNFDDKGEAVEARIKSFNEQTRPVLAAYSQTIDIVRGEQDVESVHRDMSSVIDTFYAEISATITLPYVA